MSNVNAVTDDNFEAEVMKSTLPVLVDFWAPWCGPCRMIAPILDELSNEFAGKVKIVKVDIDSNQKVASTYNIRSIPTLLIVKDGQIIEQIVGAQPKTALATKLSAL
jgi:thioredoxin 1